jgi:hypothetical protein
VLRSGYPRLAVVTAFFASGVFHLLVLAGGGPTPILLELAIQILGFFLLHSALVLVEYRLGWNQSPPQSWPLFLARARTLILVTLISPILLDPFARLAHVHGRQIEPAREPTPIRSPAIARVQGLEREQYLKQAR